VNGRVFVLGVAILPLSIMFLLEFGTVPDLLAFFSHLIFVNKADNVYNI